jgi:outer membrane protein OmpA-like peptidoglycan-associated protein
MSYLTGATGVVTAGARQAVHAVEGTSLRRWLWPLLAILAVLLAIIFWPRNSRVAFNVEDQVRMASEKATAALAALKPGFAPQDLTNALNLEIINFQTGSAQIPDYSTAFLNKAAEVIKTAPAGMVIEIGGHTDNTGDAAANLTLSQQRADAVRNYLIQQGVAATQLTAKGYGDTQPVGSNDTDEGRFRNRRIQFTAH